ncbi:MAG: hypothetical protein HQ483_21800 [Rhodospirillales bacterium]|nr:hypothetical protein [Rhodospirillales bacterium]
MNFKSIKAPLWGAVGGAIVMAIVGFSWGGWVTENKASIMSAQAADIAVLARLTPICVSQYRQDTDKVEKLAAFKELNNWDKGAYVSDQGWSLIPGEKETDSNVSRDCALALSELTG